MRLLLSILVSSFIFSSAHAAEGGNFGLGIMLGEPSAVTARYTSDKIHAYQGGVAFTYNNWTLVYFDGLYQFANAFGTSTEFLARTTPYVGVGGVAVISSYARGEKLRSRYFDTSDTNLALGLRVPIGAEWRAATLPVGVFLEIAPGLTIIPGTYGFIHIGIGARYYF